jgi:enoyl-[acyl-carrier-protein] reductase (NADH)
MMAADHRGMSLKGKTVVVSGVADESSLAWAIAKRFAEHGARVFIGYQQKFFSRVRLLLLHNPGVPGTIEVLVHAVAFAPNELSAEPASACSAEANAL